MRRLVLPISIVMFAVVFIALTAVGAGAEPSVYAISSSTGVVRVYGADGQGDLEGEAPYRVAAMAMTASGQGYWLADERGTVFTFGDAPFAGGTAAMTLNRPIVGLSRTASGAGYWLLGYDGGIFSFGDAQFYGSTGGWR